MSERKPVERAIPPEPNASDQPHDVLAAEEFAMPAPEAARHDGPVALPPDPSGIEEPHDVLAAEEFAMPAPPPGTGFAQEAPVRRSRGGRATSVATRAFGFALAVAFTLAVRRRRARRRG